MTSDTFIKGTVTGIPNEVTITNDGSLLSPKDDVPLTGGGTTAIIQVGNVGSGEITEVLIDDAGSGYVIGDTITLIIKYRWWWSYSKSISCQWWYYTRRHGTVGYNN